MANKDTKTPAKPEADHTEPTVFNFPEHGIVVEAQSLEEANQLLEERLESLSELKKASDGSEDTE